MIRSKTLGDLREETKNLPDDMPIYIDCENEFEDMALISIKEKVIKLYDEETDEKIDEIKVIVFGVS